MEPLLWKKVQQLPEIRKEYLMTLYSNKIPFIIRSTAPEIFEDQNWSKIDFNNPAHQQFANDEFFKLIHHLRTKYINDQNPRNLEFMSASENVANLYYDRGFDFVAKMKQITEAEMNEVISEMAHFGSSKFITVDDIGDNINLLKRSVHQSENEIRKLHRGKEHYVIKVHDLAKRYCNLRQFKMTGQPMNARITKYESDTHTLESAVNSYKPFFASEIKKTVQNIDRTNAALKAVQIYVLKQELGRWNYFQRLEALGFQSINITPLSVIQSWCESIAEMLWIIKQQLETLIGICDVDSSFANLKDKAIEMARFVINQIKNLVSETFVVEKQPTQVVKKGTQFVVDVRLLVGIALNIHMSKPEVTARLLNETQRRNLSPGCKLTEKNNCGEILNHKAQLECVKFNNCKAVIASFKSMKLERPKRGDKKSMESVMDEKFTLAFQSEFKIGGEIPVISTCFSLPISVTVHGNQDPKAWATIFWDNAFSKPNRIAFEVPEEVTWKQLSEALNVYFKKEIGKELNNESLNYLATKLFGHNLTQNFDERTVTWTMFTKEQLNTNHIFSDWIFSAVKLFTSKDNNLKYVWDENLIVGFISKSDAEEKLRNKPKGTFLLRFSDSALGSISIAAVGENNEVFMVAPWCLKDFAARSLADRIMDIHNLTHLYPDIPKEMAFRKHCSTVEESNQPKPAANGKNYVPAILTTSLHQPFTTRLDFNTNISSPSQQSDFSEDFSNFGDNSIDIDELLDYAMTMDLSTSGELPLQDLIPYN